MAITFTLATPRGKDSLTILEEYDVIEYHDSGDPCPVHKTEFRKMYTFGSTMSAETEVCIFKGCKCAVSLAHHPAGCETVARYHTSFNSASGVGRLRAADWAAKLR